MKTADFLQSYGIEELRLQRDGDIRHRDVSRVEVAFGSGEDGAQAYRVDFKLLDQASDAHHHLRRIGPAPDCTVEWTDAGAQLGPDEKAARLTQLLNAIRDRVDKVHKEQSILNIQPVGKSFLLMGKTRFEVLSEDGEGQLRIRLHREDEVSEAGLNANDLLDGLYTGLITRA